MAKPIRVRAPGQRAVSFGGRARVRVDDCRRMRWSVEPAGLWQGNGGNDGWVGTGRDQVRTPETETLSL